MIVVGYQGIGKSSLAGRMNGVIDLESSNFFSNGERDPNWYNVYCNIAEHLSSQGFTVMMSSHQLVRDRLRSDIDKGLVEKVVCIFPSIQLQSDWMLKLHRRWRSTGSDKDYKAYKNADQFYVANIEDMRTCGLATYEIHDMNYSLSDIVDELEMRH